MFPRLFISIGPTGVGSAYSVRVRKAWWSRASLAHASATIVEVDMDLKATDEREKFREALRAAADLI